MESQTDQCNGFSDLYKNTTDCLLQVGLVLYCFGDQLISLLSVIQ